MDTDNDPEINSEDFDPVSGDIALDLRITNNCGECSQELKEASFQFEGQVPEEIVKAHQHGDGGDELSMELDVDRSERSEGKGRWTKTFYGVEILVTVSCGCQDKGDDPLWQTNFSEDCQASNMDELV